MEILKPKYIKDALAWNKYFPITKKEGNKTIKGGWIRVHDLCLIQEGEYKGKYCMTTFAKIVVLFSEVYVYEDWMEEFIGT